jgi:hypothetical protein
MFAVYITRTSASSELASLESAVRQVSCEGERILRCYKTATSEDPVRRLGKCYSEHSKL